MRRLLTLMYRSAWGMMCIFPICRKKIVFQNFAGLGYGDNPKYIAEKLKTENLKLYWAVNDMSDNSLPDGIKKLKYKSLRYLYHTATAKVLVDNIRKPFIIKRKGQFYMQTWHGGLCIKKIEKAVLKSLDLSYVKSAIKDAKATDVMLSDSAVTTKNIRDNFWYGNGEIIEKGLPRNDCLVNFNPSKALSVREKYNIPEDVKLLLYAPTFRKNLDTDNYNLDYSACIKALEKRFGGKWKILLRLHPNVNKKNISCCEYLIPANNIADITELYLISDALITDYSSSIFDFSLLRRPSFIYANDLESYSKERGFFFNLNTLPFQISETNESLCQNILEFDEKIYLKNLEDFIKTTQRNETGNASDYAACRIMEKLTN